MIVEVEVDSLAQLEQVLPEVPDLVLLDNMQLDELRLRRRAARCDSTDGGIGSVRRNYAGDDWRHCRHGHRSN